MTRPRSNWSAALALGPAVALLCCCGDNLHPAEPDAAALDCTEPTAGMTLTASTELCSGTFALVPGKASMGAAITIDADDVTLRCRETVLEGGPDFGTVDAPTIGIAIGAHKRIHIEGCTVRSYRYGIYAKGASDLTLTSLHLDHNFDDPKADWVQDTVKGGGVRFDGVQGGAVTGSTLAHNWNAIELRDGTRGIAVKHVVADHCSNTGATLVDAHDNVFEDDDFSYAVRGGLTFPNHWYGVDTKDSAGVIVDGGSTGNRFFRNDFTYGGDGIFVRSVIGACATDNVFEGNDASLSPHNAIESWCDRNQFLGNTASQSTYGIWLGGSDDAIVRDNIVDKSLVDGISIQIGEDRHSIIEHNQVTGSRRVGILLTGREYQAWDPLTNWAARLANSSHILVQDNQLSGNHKYDVFVTATRALVLASNCGDNGGEPNVMLGRDAELTTQVGSCGAATGATAPTVELPPLPAQTVGKAFMAASVVPPADPAAPLAYSWLVQPSGMSFPSLVLPKTTLAKTRIPRGTQSLTIPRPGLYDIDLAVDDGKLAALAHIQVPVISTGPRVGQVASDWTFVCDGFDACTTTSDDATEAVFAGTSVHVRTDAPFSFRMTTPATGSLDLRPGNLHTFGFFIRSRNDNGNGWQGNQPIVVIKTSNGETRYEPAAVLLARGPGEWIYVEVPLAGGGGFTRTGPALGKIEQVSILTDTFDYLPIDLWVVGASFY